MATLAESMLRKIVKEELRKALLEQQAPEGSIAGSGGSTYKYHSIKGAELAKLIKPEQLESLKKDPATTESVNLITADVYKDKIFIPFYSARTKEVVFHHYVSDRKRPSQPPVLQNMGVKLPRTAFNDDISKYLNDYGYQG